MVNKEQKAFDDVAVVLRDRESTEKTKNKTSILNNSYLFRGIQGEVLGVYSGAYMLGPRSAVIGTLTGHLGVVGRLL